MINLFKAKAAQVKSDRRTPTAQLRLRTDLQSIYPTEQFDLSYLNGWHNPMEFRVSVFPDEGYYKGGNFVFDFEVPFTYPHEPPMVKCKTKVYHPNIDLAGNVYLKVLREDWNPDLNIGAVLNGLLDLFMQPNYYNPLNDDAAAELRDNPKKFETNVITAMRGGCVGETSFTRCVRNHILVVK